MATTSTILKTEIPKLGFVSGDLVRNEAGLIVIVISSYNGGTDKAHFSGVVVFSDTSYRPVGFYYSSWETKFFSPFRGTIQITNL